jgi:integrase
VKKGLCEGLRFKIQKPKVDNLVTDNLTRDQLQRLIQAIDEDPHVPIGNLMKFALFTGMRRGEIFNLKWTDLDFEREFITIKNPKGGKDQAIPMNDEARRILENHPRVKKSPYVFANRHGKKRRSVQHLVNDIKKKAGLPKNFRPLHGLRHVYASMLASSGQVDMYTLQKLLTHKDPRMTQRYAHLRDEALRKASNLAGGLISEVMNEKEDSAKVRA